MNKAELINAVAERSEQSAAATGAVLAAFEAVVTEAVAKGDKVQLAGFLTFDAADRAARTGRNPRTGETLSIPASRAPAFKAGKALKDALN